MAQLPSGRRLLAAAACKCALDILPLCRLLLTAHVALSHQNTPVVTVQSLPAASPSPALGVPCGCYFIAVFLGRPSSTRVTWSKKPTHRLRTNWPHDCAGAHPAYMKGFYTTDYDPLAVCNDGTPGIGYFLVRYNHKMLYIFNSRLAACAARDTAAAAAHTTL